MIEAFWGATKPDTCTGSLGGTATLEFSLWIRELCFGKMQKHRLPLFAMQNRAGFWIAATGRLVVIGCMPEIEALLEAHLRKTPVIGRGVYIAPGAVVVGDVTLGDYSSVWHGAVLRGDINRIVVGHHTNIQDNAVLHLTGELPCVVGDYVTVGHAAVVHACIVGNEVLIGMGAVILDGAVIGEQSIVGAKALVTQGTQIPPGSLVLGVPARVVRQLTADERARFKVWADEYVRIAMYCLQHGNVTKPRSSI